MPRETKTNSMIKQISIVRFKRVNTMLEQLGLEALLSSCLAGAHNLDCSHAVAMGEKMLPRVSISHNSGS
jgi:hypothetical protein